MYNIFYIYKVFLPLKTYYLYYKFKYLMYEVLDRKTLKNIINHKNYIHFYMNQNKLIQISSFLS